MSLMLWWLSKPRKTRHSLGRGFRCAMLRSLPMSDIYELDSQRLVAAFAMLYPTGMSMSCSPVLTLAQTKRVSLRGGRLSSENDDAHMQITK